jgi:hypothetical protein
MVKIHMVIPFNIYGVPVVIRNINGIEILFVRGFISSEPSSIIPPVIKMKVP